MLSTDVTVTTTTATSSGSSSRAVVGEVSGEEVVVPAAPHPGGSLNVSFCRPLSNLDSSGFTYQGCYIMSFLNHLQYHRIVTSFLYWTLFSMAESKQMYHVCNEHLWALIYSRQAN